MNRKKSEILDLMDERRQFKNGDNQKYKELDKKIKYEIRQVIDK